MFHHACALQPRVRTHATAHLTRQLDVVLLQDRRPGNASVENVRIEVRSVRPNYSAQVRIHTNLSEVFVVA